MINPFILIPLLLLLVLAAGPAWVEGSWKRFALNVPLTFLVVILPIAVFLLSAFLLPDWKGACRLGWLDGFHLGKLALLPIVLWATSALYAVEVCRTTDNLKPWVVTGLATGALTAGICFMFGAASLATRRESSLIWLLVPLYIAIWHGLRAVQLGRRQHLSGRDYGAALIGSLPFWGVAAYLSRRAYESLPDQPPSCFVVTAAMRGHAGLVGPLFPVNHHGHIRQANQQLLTLWRFESRWRQCAPRSHAGFRKIYNRIGPRIARKIVSPWRADLAYICLKPMEILAGAILFSAPVSRATLKPA